MLNNGFKKDIREEVSVIGGDESKRRGVVLAKSISAKKLGIVTGESLFSARKKCPNLNVYSPSHKIYEEYSKKLYDYLCDFSPDVEQCSIDECFLEYTGMEKLLGNYMDTAITIKNTVKEKFGFTVNIGIGNCKLCAKMASDFEKPDKIHTLFFDEIKTKMWPLPIGDLFMVGKSSKEAFLKMGIKTIGDLANYNYATIVKRFGVYGEMIYKYANGIDESKLNDYLVKQKGISHSVTLPYNMHDEEELKKVLYSLANQIGRTLRKNKEIAKVVAITLKNSFFHTYSHQIKLNSATSLTSEIHKHACKLLEEMWRDEAIRLIGLRVEVSKYSGSQISLFDNKEVLVKDEKLETVLDSIKDKYGDEIITRAEYLDDL